MLFPPSPVFAGFVALVSGEFEFIRMFIFGRFPETRGVLLSEVRFDPVPFSAIGSAGGFERLIGIRLFGGFIDYEIGLMFGVLLV